MGQCERGNWKLLQGSFGVDSVLLGGKTASIEGVTYAIPMDHDQRFKALIREFFAEFLQLFFADWAARFDLSTIQWLETEALPNPPEGSRHQLDLVARMRTKQRLTHQQGEEPEAWLTLVHIEIEARDQTTRVKPRLPVYYIHLRQQHQLPVLPIVLYLKVGMEGIGVDAYEEIYGDLCLLRFQYLYVGLPGLSGVEYVAGDNWLGVALAALMSIPREQMVWLGAEALRRLSRAPLSDQQRFLLGDCVEAYLELDADQRREYDRLIESTSEEGLKAMNKTTYDRGLEQGIEQGIEQGEVRGAQRMLLSAGRLKLDEPPPQIIARIGQISDIDQLESLLGRIADVDSWEELLQRA